jgi:hypothetical protein
MKTLIAYFQTLKPKHQLLLMLIGASVILYYVHVLNFKKSLDAYTDYNDALMRSDSLEKAITLLSSNKNFIEQDAEDISLMISDPGSDVELKEIIQYRSDYSQRYVIETSKLTLRGKYNDILAYVNRLEKKDRVIINSISFETTQNKQDKKHELNAVLYIKSVKHETTN